jgi:outer membrane protein
MAFVLFEKCITMYVFLKMKKTVSFLVLNIFLAMLLSSRGQKNMNLKECMDATLKNNLVYKQSLLNFESAMADRDLAKSNKNPQFSGYLGQSTNIGRSIDRSTNTYINELYNANFMGLQFQVPIFNGFQLQHQVQQFNALVNANEKTAEASKNNLTIQVLQAYIQTIGTQELMDAAMNQVATSKLQVERTNSQFEAGTVGQTALFEIKAQLANDAFALVSAKNAHQSARLSLFQLMNIPPNANIQFEKIEVPSVSSTLIDSEVIYQKALGILPEIKSAEFRIKGTESLLKATKANAKPSINLSGNYGTFFASSNTTDEYFNQLNGNRNGSLGFSVNVPIWAKLQNSPRVASARVQGLMAENVLQTNKQQIRQAIELAALNATAASERFQSATDQEQILSQNVAAQERRLEAGTVSLIDFVLAKTNYARAVANLVQAKYDFLLQQKLIGFYQSGKFDIE